MPYTQPRVFNLRTVCHGESSGAGRWPIVGAGLAPPMFHPRTISLCVRGLISSARNLQETAFPPSVRQVYEGMDPMEEANRLRREGALDFLQYRWVGAVLCRGAGRLERPVVWSTFVRIADGPK